MKIRIGKTYLFKTVFACVLTGALIFLIPANICNAEEISLSVNPPLIEVVKKGREEISEKFVLINSGSSTLDIKVLLRPFRALSEDGSIEIIPENQVPISYKNLFSDVKIIDNGLEVREFQIAPEQTKNLEIKIDDMDKAGSEDFYFTVIFMAGSEKSRDADIVDDSFEQEEIVSGFSVIEAGIGMNVILSEDRESAPNAEIAEFSAPGTSQSGPIPFKVRIKNNGATVIKPKGVILIKNMFGQAIGRVELDEANILSGSIRSLTDTSYRTRRTNSPNTGDSAGTTAVWNEELLLGPYSADLSLALSDKGPVLNKSIYFVGLPVVTVLIFLVFIGFVIFIILRINHYLKRQK